MQAFVNGNQNHMRAIRRVYCPVSNFRLHLMNQATPPFVRSHSYMAVPSSLQHNAATARATSTLVIRRTGYTK